MKGEQLAFEFREDDVVFIMENLGIISCDYDLVKDSIRHLLKKFPVMWIVQNVTAIRDLDRYHFWG